jgi:hypothetical protein
VGSEMCIRDRYKACVTLSLTDLIKEVRAIAPKGKKGDYEANFRERIAPYTEVGESTKYVGRVR